MILALAAASVLALCDPTLKSCTQFGPPDAIVIHRAALCKAMDVAWRAAADEMRAALADRGATMDERYTLMAPLIASAGDRSIRCYAWARGERDVP